MTKKILGILNLEKYSKLGELLFFIENLKIKKYFVQSELVDIAILSENKDKLFSFQLPLIYNYLDIDNCFLFNSQENFNKFLEKHNYKLIFPSKTEEGNPLDTTIPLQNFFSEKKFIPSLESKPEIKNFCRDFLEKHAKQKIKIIVHLKNIPNENSNSNQTEWYKFFKYCEDNFKDMRFFLIGNDLINKEIAVLSNVIITKNKNLNIIQELALIEQADLFIGMCSGPFQVALFNKKPYVVFKNPEHHKDHMAQELGNSNKFSFSADKQFIFRENETFDLLLKNFNNVLK